MRRLLAPIRPARALSWGLALLLVSHAAVATPAMQDVPEVAVVAHPGVPIDNLTLAELRRMLLGDKEFWAAGVRVRLLIHAPVAHERDVVVKDVCEMTEAQFRQHWIGKVFRADAVAGPRIVYSTEMAIDQTSRTPGAIAFVPAPVTSTAVKVLKIDGRTPGQPGYALK
jgi:hypothetical protein